LPDIDEERQMGASPRPFWSGAISFGLVNIPVSLFPANRQTRFLSACSVRKDTLCRDGIMYPPRAVRFRMNSSCAGTRLRKMNTSS